MSSHESFRDFLRHLGEVWPPQLRYEGGDTPRAFKAWQRRFRAKLRALRGPLPPRPKPDLVVDATEEFSDHFRRHVTFRSIFDTRVPAYLLVPKDRVVRARPGVLVFHGHHPRGKGDMVLPLPAEQQRAGKPPEDCGLAAVRAGFVALCPDWWGWGERAEAGFDFRGADMCDVKFRCAQMYGLSLLSIMLADAEAAFDALAARPEVDGTRIGVMGHSFGGRMAMWMAALHPRVRAAVCSGCLNCFRERSLTLGSCGAQFFPGLLRWGDTAEVFSLIAPRPLMILVGSRDPVVEPGQAAQMKPIIARAYAILGAEQRLVVHDFDGGHSLPQPPAINFLRRCLGA